MSIDTDGLNLVDFSARLAGGLLPAGVIPWASVSKSGSSLADLATRSATDLTSGTLDNARLASSYTAITSLANLTTVGALASGSIAAGFGNINNAGNSLTTGA